MVLSGEANMLMARQPAFMWNIFAAMTAQPTEFGVYILTTWLVTKHKIVLIDEKNSIG